MTVLFSVVQAAAVLGEAVVALAAAVVALVAAGLVDPLEYPGSLVEAFGRLGFPEGIAPAERARIDLAAEHTRGVGAAAARNRIRD